MRMLAFDNQKLMKSRVVFYEATKTRGSGVSGCMKIYLSGLLTAARQFVMA